MQSKSGPRKQTKTITRTTFTPPTEPANLSDDQKQVWTEIITNPYLTNQDHSLMTEFIKLTVLCDVSFESLMKDGVMIDDAKGSMKTNPAYKIWRDTSDKLLRLREHLLMTPKTRMLAALAVTIEEEEDELAALVC